jgi:hypothetical protein
MEINIYVKPNTNCGPLPLMTFEVIGEVWRGESLTLPFGPDGEEHQVVGWCSLFGGSTCPVSVAQVRLTSGETGFLVWGGDWGVRVLDDSVFPAPGEERLPRGWGMPIIWVADPNDLPPDVRAVVEP